MREQFNSHKRVVKKNKKLNLVLFTLPRVNYFLLNFQIRK